MNRWARERMSRGGGGQACWISSVVVIHIPPSKKYISNSNPYDEVIYLYTYGRQNPVVAHAIHVLYMVGKIQFRVTCLRYWILSTCVGTKKPHVGGVWLNSWIRCVVSRLRSYRSNHLPVGRGSLDSSWCRLRVRPLVSCLILGLGRLWSGAGLQPQP